MSTPETDTTQTPEELITGPSLTDRAADTLLEAQAAPPSSPAAPPEPTEPRFQDLSLDINLSRTVCARVQIMSTDGKGFSLTEFRRLIAALEIQRSFLAEEPLEVSVRFATPKALA